ncbi:hypothetical protein ACLB2K_011126 [Fragaria x ananassa]
MEHRLVATSHCHGSIGGPSPGLERKQNPVNLRELTCKAKRGGREQVSISHRSRSVSKRLNSSLKTRTFYGVCICRLTHHSPIKLLLLQITLLIWVIKIDGSVIWVLLFLLGLIGLSVKDLFRG